MANKLSKFLYFVVCFCFFTLATLYFSDLLVYKLLNGFTFSNQFFALNYVENSGAAFGILQDAHEILIIVSVVAICLIASYIIKNLANISMKSIFFLSMLAAGIGSNLHERIIFGFVRDFMEIKFVEFPVFNISDILINIGVLAVIVILLMKKL